MEETSQAIKFSLDSVSEVVNGTSTKVTGMLELSGAPLDPS